MQVRSAQRLQMNRNTLKYLSTAWLMTAAFLLSACGSGLKLGDTDAVKEAEKLAIACKTDEALAALDRASENGGISASLGDLLRVVFLRDAGRMSEADAAMAERNRRWNADAKNIAESEEAVAKTVEKLREERLKQTGRRTCE